MRGYLEGKQGTVEQSTASLLPSLKKGLWFDLQAETAGSALWLIVSFALQSKIPNVIANSQCMRAILSLP